MSKTEEVKVLLMALPAFSQQVLLDELLQNFEVLDKVLGLVYQEMASEILKKDLFLLSM